MNAEQQRIAIAEACGWVNIGWQPRNCFDEATDRMFGNTKDWYRLAREGTVAMQDDLPDYLGDLNAMHEAEKVLQTHMAKWWNYASQLAVMNKSLGHGGEAHATAAQRAEAFLRTLNLWETK